MLDPIPYKELYQLASPFPSIVIDDFFSSSLIASAAEEVRSLPEEAWNGGGLAGEHSAQRKKSYIDDPSKVTPALKELMAQGNSPQFLSFLIGLTGIQDLKADPSYLGGGLHRVKSGGHLSIHADFNWHPSLQMHRRVNLLLYLNKDWKEEWGGSLELWTRDMQRCERKILPTLNRTVIFTITDDAFHGHPDPISCPEGEARYSMALYYYTQSRPFKEMSSPHWALWQNRPGRTL